MSLLAIGGTGGVGSHVTALLEQGAGAVLASPGGRIQLAALVVVMLLASLFESM